MKVSAGTWKLKGLSSVAVRSGMGLATVGASLVLLTVSSKVSLTVPPLPSSAVTAILKIPTSSLVGVPLKVAVLALKLSQLGKGEPSARVAE